MQSHQIASGDNSRRINYHYPRDRSSILLLKLTSKRETPFAYQAYCFASILKTVFVNIMQYSHQYSITSLKQDSMIAKVKCTGNIVLCGEKISCFY